MDLALFGGVEQREADLVHKISKSIATTAITLSVLASSASAGTVTLMNTAWKKVCLVETSCGRDAPWAGITMSHFDVTWGQMVRICDDKLCVRRSQIPSNCNSGLSDWRCESETTDGVRLIDLD